MFQELFGILIIMLKPFAMLFEVFEELSARCQFRLSIRYNTFQQGDRFRHCITVISIICNHRTEFTACQTQLIPCPLRLIQHFSCQVVSFFNFIARGFKAISGNTHFVSAGIHILKMGCGLLGQFAQRLFSCFLLIIQCTQQGFDLFFKTRNNLLSFLMQGGLCFLLMTAELLLALLKLRKQIT
ncbi:hypothetical protein D3C80_1419590 [compost metagenome]